MKSASISAFLISLGLASTAMWLVGTQLGAFAGLAPVHGLALLATLALLLTLWELRPNQSTLRAALLGAILVGGGGATLLLITHLLAIYLILWGLVTFVAMLGGLGWAHRAAIADYVRQLRSA